MRNVLVVSSVADPPRELQEALGDDVGEILASSPSLQQSRLQWLTNAEDDARRGRAHRRGDHPRRRARPTACRPRSALRPAARRRGRFTNIDADEIVVVTRTGEDASWLEEGAAETIAARFPQLPVTTIEL